MKVSEAEIKQINANEMRLRKMVFGKSMITVDREVIKKFRKALQSTFKRQFDKAYPDDLSHCWRCGIKGVRLNRDHNPSFDFLMDVTSVKFNITEERKQLFLDTKSEHYKNARKYLKALHESPHFKPILVCDKCHAFIDAAEKPFNGGSKLNEAYNTTKILSRLDRFEKEYLMRI